MVTPYQQSIHSILTSSIETPSNPQLKVTDVERVSAIAKSILGADKVAIVVDATWATPYLLKPLQLGADFSLHSCTKYIGGHSDVLGGILTMGDTVASRRLSSKLKFAHQVCGGVAGPWESYMSLRGLRSLHVRMDRHCSNGLAVASFLSCHTAVQKTYYPGLDTHPQHDLARTQMSDKFGGMVSFLVKPSVDGGDGYAEAMEVIKKVMVFRRATSLGGTESLIEHRRSVEGVYGSSPPNLIRLSVGLETAADLIEDLDQALRF